MFIRSRTIPPSIFKSTYFRLIGFWESWLFNYPLILLIYFYNLNLMDWHWTKGFPPCMSHEPMFQISTKSVEAIKSYWSASVGHWIWVLMVVMENDLEYFLMFSFDFLVILEFPFAYQHVYKPLISTLWASFAPFSICTVWEKPKSESILEFCEERGFSFKFVTFSIPSRFFKWENFSKCEKSKFSFTFTLFLNSKHYFPNFNIFFTHRTPMRLTHLLWIAFTHFHP